MPRRLVPGQRSAPRAATLDEAFASVTDADFRRADDRNRASSEVHDAGAATGDLAEALRTQLAAIDAQRRDLARLLEGLDG